MRTPRTWCAQGNFEPTPTPPRRGTDKAPLLGGAGGGFMESSLFHSDLLTGHEPAMRKSLEISTTTVRFMES